MQTTTAKLRTWLIVLKNGRVLPVLGGSPHEAYTIAFHRYPKLEHRHLESIAEPMKPGPWWDKDVERAKRHDVGRFCECCQAVKFTDLGCQCL